MRERTEWNIKTARSSDATISHIHSVLGESSKITASKFEEESNKMTWQPDFSSWALFGALTDGDIGTAALMKVGANVLLLELPLCSCQIWTDQFDLLQAWLHMSTYL